MDPFKNAISPDLVRLIGTLLGARLPAFDADAFTNTLTAQLDSLELKERVKLVADALHTAVPADHTERRRIILSLLHPDEHDHANRDSTADGLCGWGIWPLTTLIGLHGLGDPETSLEVLRQMTKRGTSEFDVRPFIAADPKRSTALMSSWVTDPNHHVRRLVSEGTRPRLPWGMRLNALIEDPTPMIPALTALRDDPSDYVRRSVANHLNDIAKDHPDLVATIAGTWMKDANPNRKKLIRHACRTLIKNGHPPALAVFGILPPKLADPVIQIHTPNVTLGGALKFDVTLKSLSEDMQTLTIDYVLYLRKANGSLSPKVFKWSETRIAPDQTLTLSRKHALKPVTVRTYYTGEHALSVRINGTDWETQPFTLTVP